MKIVWARTAYSPDLTPNFQSVVEKVSQWLGCVGGIKRLRMTKEVIEQLDSALVLFEDENARVFGLRSLARPSEKFPKPLT